MNEDDLIQCGFCGRSETECKRIIVGPGGACICSECVLNCVIILFGEEEGIEAGTSPEQDEEKE